MNQQVFVCSCASKKINEVQTFKIKAEASRTVEALFHLFPRGACYSCGGSAATELMWSLGLPHSTLGHMYLCLKEGWVDWG